MKILERKNVEEWEYIWTCKGCGSKIQCDVNDLYYGGTGIDNDDLVHVNCPVCSTQITFLDADTASLGEMMGNPHSLPGWVMREVLRRLLDQSQCHDRK